MGFGDPCEAKGAFLCTKRGMLALSKGFHPEDLLRVSALFENDEEGGEEVKRRALRQA